MLVAWLRIQAALLALGSAVFGLGFPVLGLGIGLTGLAPPGEDPLGVAVGVGVAGACTGVVYAVPGVLCAVAARKAARDRAAAQVWVVVASVVSAFVCVLGIAPLVLLATDVDVHPSPSPPGRGSG